MWSVAIPSASECGERPLWDDESGTVVWVDIPAGEIHRAVPGASLPWDDTTFTVGSSVGVAVLRTGGGLVAAVDSAVVFLDRDGAVDADPVDVQLPTNTSFNDGMCDPAGRFVVGTSSDPAGPPNGVLYSMGSDLDVRVLLTDIGESNGLDWSLDGKVMYYVDSFEPVVRRYSYDVATGDLGARLSDLVVVENAGQPDGLIVDDEGSIWMTLWDGAAVRRYSPSGELLLHLDAPVEKLTCPAFIGPDLTTFVVTSAWMDCTPEQLTAQPWAGHMLTAEVPGRGRLPFRFTRDAR